MLATIAAARAGSARQDEPIEVFGPPELHTLMLAACHAAHMPLTTPVVVRGWVMDPERRVDPEPAVRAGFATIGNLLFGMQAPDQARSIPKRVAEDWQASYDNGSDNVVRRGMTWTTVLPGGVRVTAAQLQHRMPCWGYVFEEPQESLGDTLVRPGRKMVLLGDTCDSTAIANAAHGCDVISHEATYSRGMEEKAAVATHSTSEQAGEFARRIRAKALVLTHFSARYEQADKFAKKWATAKEMGMTVGELSASVCHGLLEEARSCAGDAKVFLAQDFFTFKVRPREPVTEEELVEQEARRKAAADLKARKSPSNIPAENNGQRRAMSAGVREQRRRY